MSDDRSSQGEEAIPNEPTELQLTRPAEFRHVFSNNSRVRVGNGEIGITFSFAEEISGTAHMTDLISVTVTPVHAKRIAVILAEILKQYEARMGAIVMQAPTPTPLDMQLVMRNVRAILSQGEGQSESERSS